jgi:hypothetical protein
MYNVKYVDMNVYKSYNCLFHIICKIYDMKSNQTESHVDLSVSFGTRSSTKVNLSVEIIKISLFIPSSVLLRSIVYLFQ